MRAWSACAAPKRPWRSRWIATRVTWRWIRNRDRHRSRRSRPQHQLLRRGAQCHHQLLEFRQPVQPGGVLAVCQGHRGHGPLVPPLQYAGDGRKREFLQPIGSARRLSRGRFPDPNHWYGRCHRGPRQPHVAQFQREGELIFLLGEVTNCINASEYLASIAGVTGLRLLTSIWKRRARCKAACGRPSNGAAFAPRTTWPTAACS